MGLLSATTSFGMLLKIKGRQNLPSHMKLVVFSKVCLRLKLKAKTETQIKKLKVYKSCLPLKQDVRMLSHVQLCDPMDWSHPGSSVHGIFQARILECAAISSPRWSSWPRDRTLVSCIAGSFFTIRATRVALTFMWNLKELNSEVESIMVVVVGWRVGKRRCWWKGTRF